MATTDNHQSFCNNKNQTFYLDQNYEDKHLKEVANSAINVEKLLRENASNKDKTQLESKQFEVPIVKQTVI